MIIKKNAIITVFILTEIGFTSVAEADLLPETVNGINVVYDTVTNVTWTADANLLGTLENQAIAQTGSDVTLLNTIISDSNGVINDLPNNLDSPNQNSGIYNLSLSDFSSNDLVDWWGAQAFINYLNNISYGGVSDWSLPIALDTGESSNQLSQLFSTMYLDYANAGQSYIQSIFTDLNYNNIYWLSNENITNPGQAFNLVLSSPEWFVQGKNVYSYAWAVSPGNITAVPLPSAFWFFIGFWIIAERQKRFKMSLANNNKI